MNRVLQTTTKYMVAKKKMFEEGALPEIVDTQVYVHPEDSVVVAKNLEKRDRRNRNAAGDLDVVWFFPVKITKTVERL